MRTLRGILAGLWADLAALIVASILYLVPFMFIVLMAAKTAPEAALFEFSLPSKWRLFENIRAVIQFANYRMLLAFWNSAILTVGSVVLIVLLAALVAFVMQRRRDRVASVASSFMLAGLIIPPAVVPTIFLLQWLHIYKTIFGLIFVEVAFQLSFATLVFRAFMGTIPSEIDEAAIIDGASPLQLFFSVILPLLRPAIVTVTVVSAVTIYNDFVGPLYFLPGEQNVTVQLTLYSFMSQFKSSWNLLFADVLLATVPPLVMFMFFQRQMVSGMVAGAIKG
jgi:raffinose/stachyose/melibiose transport system permease protein